MSEVNTVTDDNGATDGGIIVMPFEPTAIRALTKDLKQASRSLGDQGARYLVGQYYDLQALRIRARNQLRTVLEANEENAKAREALAAEEPPVVEEGDEDVEELQAEVPPLWTPDQVEALEQQFASEPHAALLHFALQYEALEKQAQAALDEYSISQPLGAWARQHVGVGPVLAAGLLAHIEVARAPYASSVWRFAGLAPGQKKKKGEKRDWNADLKLVAFKLGDSFTKQSGREKCYYGHLYVARRVYESGRNNQVKEVPDAGWYEIDGTRHEAVQIGDKWFVGGNARTAAQTLSEKNIREPKTRKTYESGKLPEGRLIMMARRYAVKRFFADYWKQAYWFAFGTEPPSPWVHAHGGHRHIEDNPFVPIVRQKAPRPVHA